MDKSTPLRCLSNRKWVSLPIFICILTLGNLQGQIVANFEAGDTDEEVDGYVGKPGLGWSSAWTSTAHSDTTISPSVINSNPLRPGGGNYLNAAIVSTRVNAPTAGVARKYENYGNVSLGAEHTIRFTYRLDSGLESITRLMIFNSDSMTGDYKNSDTTQWIIRGGTNSWGFLNGSSENADIIWSDVAMYETDSYAFEITVNPAEQIYMVFVENLDHAAKERMGASSYSNTFDFTSTEVRSSVSETINFMQRMNQSDEGGVQRSVEFSLGEISIIPEPGNVSMVLGGGVLFSVLLWARSRRPTR